MLDTAIQRIHVLSTSTTCLCNACLAAIYCMAPTKDMVPSGTLGHLRFAAGELKYITTQSWPQIKDSDEVRLMGHGPSAPYLSEIPVQNVCIAKQDAVR